MLAISIHTFLAEGDLSRSLVILIGIISIHTFLAEGDHSTEQWCIHEMYFNPHLPCGRRQAEEMDKRLEEAFQSTPSLRKATMTQGFDEELESISIHTFLAEGDDVMCLIFLSVTHFNPHLPCGRRPQI